MEKYLPIGLINIILNRSKKYFKRFIIKKKAPNPVPHIKKLWQKSFVSLKEKCNIPTYLLKVKENEWKVKHQSDIKINVAKYAIIQEIQCIAIWQGTNKKQNCEKKEQEIAIQLSPSGIYRSIIYKFHGKQKLLVTWLNCTSLTVFMDSNGNIDTLVSYGISTLMPSSSAEKIRQLVSKIKNRLRFIHDHHLYKM